MRLITLGKASLLGGALALAMTGCKDDKSCPAIDGSVMDAGHDSGHDSGPGDAGSLPDVHLRIAQIAFGSSIPAVHLCAYDPVLGIRYALSSTALVTGNFDAPASPVPIASGSITSHLAIPESLQARLNGQTIEVYLVADAGVGAGPSFPLYCEPANPNTALAKITLGSGPGQTPLLPGHSYTFLVGGASGAEPDLATACGGGPCTPPFARLLEDEAGTVPVAAKARVRVVLADDRFGPQPGLCQYTYTGGSPSSTSSFTTILPLPTELAAHALVATPTYRDLAPIVPGAAPQILTLHPNPSGASAPPCGVVGASAPYGGYTSAGSLPNVPLNTLYAILTAAGRPLTGLRSALAANERTTLFVTASLTRFGQFGAPSTPCAPDPATAPGCVPLGVNKDTPANVCYLGTADCVPGGVDPTNSNAPCVAGTVAQCVPCMPGTLGCVWATSSIPAVDP